TSSAPRIATQANSTFTTTTTASPRAMDQGQRRPAALLVDNVASGLERGRELDLAGRGADVDGHVDGPRHIRGGAHPDDERHGAALRRAQPDVLHRNLGLGKAV